ncbi:integrator complex subunit 15-like isoform X1 [Mya arenaria]|uniref:integrator complex subunit 15-like isoform X1 n=1 Tax=Mya arenaria TaxID=6604 RepID=UPI0022E8E8C4|nr:integrator complex subunit 15-like isoform X1 [Mya arenaria]
MTNTTMSATLARLQYLDFPECSQEALIFLVKHFSSEARHGVPGRTSPGEKLAIDVAQEFIVELYKRKYHRKMKLNAVHELQLLEMVCRTLQECPEQACYKAFTAIFGGHIEAAKITLMTKLVSMAISVSCGPVLRCVALWMQEQGSQSQCVCDVAQQVVEDYGQLYPGLGPAFRALPSVSSLFTCNFVTAITTIYTYTDVSKTPPKELLECIVDWISSDPCLCSDSVRLVRIQANFTCPLGGLIRWCILGPIVTSMAGESNSSVQGGTSAAKDLKQTNTQDSKLMSLFSKLHLGVLLCLQAYQSMELNEQLFSYGDIFIVSKTLSSYYRGGQCREELIDAINTAVDRLAQIIQMALATKSLSDKFDFLQVREGLPPNRLLDMMLSMKYATQRTEAMDLS